MRAAWILLAIVILAGGAWLVFGVQGEAPVVSQPGESEAPASSEVTGGLQDGNKSTVDANVKVQDALNAVTDEVETIVNNAAEKVVEDASVAVNDAAARINDAASDVLIGEDNSDIMAGSGSAIEVQTDAHQEVLSAALTIDGFDPDFLRSEVEESNMGPVQRLAAKVLIERAEADPEEVPTVIGELKKALHIE